ncbi:hypothetical protein Rhal01_01310 [Rubritalea halochordaticola]|uniref:Uncharacterized protein n=1 Tax=Rubritalea halochordaticola TaxID=714537 RepID=A0ABP9UXF5_9BACT
MNILKRPEYIILVTLIITIPAYIYYDGLRNQRMACLVKMNNYDKSIHSLGIHTNVDEIWADPEKVKYYVYRDMKLEFPECPSGGSYTLTYGIEPYPDVPKMVCSCADSHGHKPTPKP